MRNWKLGTFVVGSLCLLVVGAQAARTFRPPSTAVIDIAQVFDQYEKRRDRQDQLQAETKTLEDQLKDLERRYKDIEAELPQIESDERKAELAMQKVQIQFDVDRLKKKELKRLRDTQIKYIQEIRDEITTEIQTYATAQDLDLVLEMTVTAEGEGPVGGFRWPIVHFVKPELVITKEIAERLNRRYNASR